MFYPEVCCSAGGARGRSHLWATLRNPGFKGVSAGEGGEQCWSVKLAVLEKLGPGPAACPPTKNVTRFAGLWVSRGFADADGSVWACSLPRPGLVQVHQEAPGLLWVAFPRHPPPSLVIAAANGFIRVRLHECEFYWPSGNHWLVHQTPHCVIFILLLTSSVGKPVTQCTEWVGKFGYGTNGTVSCSVHGQTGTSIFPQFFCRSLSDPGDHQ